MGNLGEPASGNDSGAFTGRPTQVRHVIVSLLTAMAVLLYLDRLCISAAAPLIMEEFHLDKDRMGWVFSAFFLAYGLGQVPAGWLGDRLGARLMMVASVLVWSAMTGLMGLATGLWSMVALRLVFGLSQAGAYPIAARINSLWIPFERRAVTSSIIALGGRAGGAIAPWLTAMLIITWNGWRPAFWLYAGVGLIWVAGFLRWFRETPGQHAGCNPMERELIARNFPQAAATSHDKASGIPWAAIMRSRSLWLQSLLQLTGTCAWTLLATWLPVYFMEVYAVDLKEAGLLSSMPLLGGMVGCLLGGLATDRLTRSYGLLWGRNLLGMSSKFLAAAGVLMCIAVDSPLLATLAFTLTSLVSDMGIGATWAYFQDTGGPYVGTFLGWANMFGNVGSFISPILLGGLAQHLGWTWALGVCAVLFTLSGLCWFGVDARVPIVCQNES